MAQILKGHRGGDLNGLLNLTKSSTLVTQIQSICATDLGTNFAAITTAMCTQAKNDLLQEIVSVLGYGTDEGLLMADAAVMAYAIVLHNYSSANAKQAASGAAIGAYAGYIARDPCCGLDREAIEVAAAFATVASMRTTVALQPVDLQTAWNDLVALGLATS